MERTRASDMRVIPHLSTSEMFKRGIRQGGASLKVELPNVWEILRLLTLVPRTSHNMGKLANLISSLLILSLYGQANCCSSSGSSFLADAGAVGSIVGGIGAAAALWYPVEVYPSRCKRKHYQVFIYLYIEYNIWDKLHYLYIRKISNLYSLN